MSTRSESIQFNNYFSNALSSGNDGSMQKLAAAGGGFIKDRVQEVSFLDKIIPPVTLTKSEVERSDTHEEPIKIEFLQPHEEAQIINFTAKAPVKTFTGKRYPVVFNKIVTPTLTKNEMLLSTYGFDIAKEIENYMIRDFARVRDGQFIATCDAIVGTTNLTATVPGPFDRTALSAGTKLLETNISASAATVIPQLVCSTVLMNKSVWDDWNDTQALDVGDAVAEDMVKNGYSYQKLKGIDVIITNKSSIVDPKYLYFFTPPEYLGHNYILSDVKFTMWRPEFQQEDIAMRAWGYFGAAIGNIRAVARIELT